MDQIKSGSFLDNAVGPSNKIIVTINNKNLEAVLDTGAVVTTMIESLYKKYFEGEMEEISIPFFRLTAANGGDILIKGYVVVHMIIREELIKNVIIIIVKDAVNASPFLIGTNVISKLNQFAKWFPEVKVTESMVVKSDRVNTIVQPNSVTMIEGSAGGPHTNTTAIIENEGMLKPGLQVMEAFIQIEKGKALIPIINATDEPLFIYPKTVLGKAYIASEHQVDVSFVNIQINNVQITSNNETKINEPDFSKIDLHEHMEPEHKESIKKLIVENQDVFAWDEFDLGYTELVKHKIVLKEEKPIAQSSRRIPPQVLPEVKQHIEELLSKKIIQPSSSPYASPIVVVRKKMVL